MSGEWKWGGRSEYRMVLLQQPLRGLEIGVVAKYYVVIAALLVDAKIHLVILLMIMPLHSGMPSRVSCG